MTSPTAGPPGPADRPDVPHSQEHAMPHDTDAQPDARRDDVPAWVRGSGGGYAAPQGRPVSSQQPPAGSPQYAQPYEDPFAGPQAAGSAPATGRSVRGRRRTAALLTLALLGAGAAGGVAGALVDGDSSGSTTRVTSSVGRTTAAAPAPSSGASGTPESAAAVISPSVVTIAVTGTRSAPGTFGQAQSQSVSDTGSGVVIRSDGYILTNNHVVSAASSGGTVSVTFSDGRTVPATIVGTDATSDLAVVKASDLSDLKAVTFADSDSLRVGQTVLAVGAPLGLANTVTEGIVSTLNRPVRTGEPGASEQSVIDAVQTDAAINPGNSGGALVDLAGNVVGINSAIATTGSNTAGGTSGNIGVGFAIPSSSAAEVADELIANGKATHPQLGVSAADAASSANGTPGRGATVQSVSGAAAAAGLRAGDLITKIDDRVVTDADSLIVAVRSHDPGNEVTVTYVRDGNTETTKATLGTAG